VETQDNIARGMTPEEARYAANERTHENGIRTALGAHRRDVLRLVMKDGAKIAFFGIPAGIAGALALTRLMASLLYKLA